MTHADLLAARAGDLAAFRRLIEIHAAPVHAAATAVLGCAAAAEDVAQDTFVAAWRQLPELRDDHAFGAWVRGIARNLARTAARAQRAGPLPDEVAADVPHPDDALDDAAAEAALWAALDALDAPDREVLSLFYREGRSVREVASRLRLDEAAVRKRLSRARGRLREDVSTRLTTRRAHADRIAVAVLAALAPGAARASSRWGWAAAVGLGLAGATGLVGMTGLVAASPPVADVRRDLPALIASATPIAPAEPAAACPTCLPRHVVHAFLAAEDARFYDHGPFDVWSIGRAIAQNAQAGEVVAGGSTLTQQLAKLLLRDDTRSVQRKLSEALLAASLESDLSKDQLLAMYLDRVYLGRGATGVQAAARAWFQRDAAELDVAQAALLAGLVAGPTRYSPDHDPTSARARRAVVLDRMVAQAWLSPADADAAKAAPLP
jgi:RNA polymerase sigma factor (sigma-70 family)